MSDIGRWKKKAADEQKLRRAAEEELRQFRRGIESIGMAVDCVLIQAALACGAREADGITLHLPRADRRLLEQYSLDVCREEDGCCLTVKEK